MTPNASRKGSSPARLGVLVAVVAVIGAAGLFAALGVRHGTEPPAATPRQITTAPVHHPSLYCDFYDFMRKSVVVSFDFDVETGAAQNPTFLERYVIEHDNARTDFGGADAPARPWAYAMDDGTPVIASPDAETRIVVYGLKPTAPGVFWVEAGVRSNAYRNLEGKCRQAYLGR